MKTSSPSPPSAWLLFGLVLLIAPIAALLGNTPLAWHNLLDASTVDFHIFWNLRVSRVLVALLAGAGLATCGMVFQALFLNTLATPFTLGVSSGASCGAAMAIYIGGLPGLFTGPSVVVGAFAGAAAATLLVLGFSQTRMGHQRHVMLLAGVAVSFFFSSLLLLIQALSSFYQSFQIIRWLMGGISVAGYREVWLLAPVLVPGLLWLVSRSRQLNLLLLGDEMAHARGLDVRRRKQWLFVVVSIIVATIVSVTGPIGFVGMVIPHICRLLWGSDHRRLAPAVIACGALSLLLCDTIARLVMPPSGLPVGVITSLIGAPFFFILLLGRRYRI